MNVSSFFNGSYLNMPGSIRFQSDPAHLHEGMDCGRACGSEMKIADLPQLHSSSYPNKKPLTKLGCCEESTHGEDFPADVQFC